jgi:hypothetical protein
MTEAAHGKAKPRFDGAKRQFQSLGDVAMGLALEKRKLDDERLFGRQFLHRRAHALLVF